MRSLTRIGPSVPMTENPSVVFVVIFERNLVSWGCRNQKIVACSFAKAEYNGIADVSAEVTWVVSLLCELGIASTTAPRLWCDNLGATYLCANPVFHAHTKHVEIDYNFVCDKVANGELHVNFISNKNQFVDIFTMAYCLLHALRSYEKSSTLSAATRELSGVY